MSAVGPGPRAQRHWTEAKEAGLKTVAKVQLNNTWELSHRALFAGHGPGGRGTATTWPPPAWME